MRGVPTSDLGVATREELSRLNLLKYDRPTLPAIVLGLAIKLLTAVENGGAGRSKMVALGGVDLP